MIVKCPSCFMDHELIRYIRKGGKSTNGVLCNKHPVLRNKKGITSVVEHSKFFPCCPDHDGKLREIFTPVARREEAAKGQGQFVMTYHTADERRVIELQEKLDYQLNEKKRIEKMQIALDKVKRDIE